MTARLLLIATCCYLAGCAPAAVSPEDATADVLPVWDVVEPLQIARAPGQPALDIAVELFDPGVSRDDNAPTAAVRRLESQLLAGDLRDTLVRSNQWGVIRLVPEASPLVPVSIRSRILHSDGRDLMLHVRAEDALGSLWFDQAFAFRQGLQGQTGFVGIFNAVSNRLLAVWSAMSPDAQSNLLEAAAVAYAESLAPEAFSGMIERSENDWQLIRLPAADDPMLGRVERIRNQEYLFCDTIDEQYVDLVSRVGPTYALWREATLEQAEWLERYEQSAANREENEGDGEFSRMQAEYAAYRSFRMQEQALFELAEAFDSESEPTVMQTQDRVVRLEGTLASQYATWRGLLRDIYLIESGVATP